MPNYTSEIYIDGRKYVNYRRAGELTGWSYRTVMLWVQSNPNCIDTRRVGRWIYVRLSDVLAYAKKMQRLQTKSQQIAIWWNSHPGEREQIIDSYDFQRRLAREGINVSSSLIRTFTCKLPPRKKPIIETVLEWLEADPDRRQKTSTEIRHLLRRQPYNLTVSRTHVKRALRHYDDLHGKEDMSGYVTSREAAALLGVCQGTVINYLHRTILIGIIKPHQGGYVQIESLNEFIAARSAT